MTVLADQPDLLLGARSRAKRTERTFDLRSGETLLLFTDGLFERRDEVLDSGLARLAECSPTSEAARWSSYATRSSRSWSRANRATTSP